MGRILVVEDDDEIRELIAEMLEDSGFDVATAANGREALERLRAPVLPCVIVLDLMMPVMNGWELRSKLLADPKLCDIPVIVVSGAADLHESPDGLMAARILTKPVKWPALLASVQAHCA